MNRIAARCPSCQSVFFVTAAQGKVANNLVRCGRCAHLFKTIDNLSDSFPEPVETMALSVQAIKEEPALESVTDEAARRGGEERDDTESSTPEETNEPSSGAAVADSAILSGTQASPFDLSKLTVSLSADFQRESAARQKTGFGRRISVSLLIIIFALVGLAGQAVFFNLATLRQRLAYRPWLQTFCNVLPCELEAYYEPGLIDVEQLMVRTHPDLKDSLLVELVLINRASLKQAYPPLILRFDGLSGQQVAARRLSATEYLPRSLSADRLMPVDKAVRIRLAILDPGERALSYSVFVGE